MKANRLTRLGTLIAIAAIFGGCSTQATQDATTTTETQAAARAPQASSAARPAQSDISAARASNAKVIPGKRSVYYEYDKAEITAEGKKLVEAHVDYLRANPALKVVIEGNADERGSSEYNVALGQRRADGVSKIMTLLGIPPERIETVSFGKEKPKAAGHTETSWSENRRSDIVYR
jgi:peptidoglycan-associated lipoprotein